MKTQLAGSVRRTPGQAGEQHSLGSRDKAAPRQLERGVFVVLCLALLAWQPVEAAGRRDVGSAPLGGVAGADFAIADFDGDALPDFATVQAGPATALRTNYWIEFEFSLGNKRSFAVSAPTGGLQIVSRDVNGDHFLDLIISTRLANEPVAVLLNDGRGNFTLADAKGFAAAIWDARQEWQAGAEEVNDSDAAMVSSGWAGRICTSSVCAELLPAIAGAAIPPEKTDYSVLPHEVRGRAPPSA